MPLELQYDSMDAIPENFRELYTEKDGVAVLTGVNNLKTPQDVANLQEALRKERDDHKATKTSLSAWGELKPEEVQAQLDRIKELEAAAEGKLDDDKINQMVESRLTQKTAPLQRQIDGIASERDEWKNKAEELQGILTTRDRNDAVRSVALEMKVQTSALDDILLIAGHYLEQSEDGTFITKNDIKGVTPGLDVKGFMKEMQRLRPHWWPPSEGGGAGGGGEAGGGKNPWSADHWNFTEQSRIVKSEGMAVAERMAKAAGTTVGGLKPKK